MTESNARTINEMVGKIFNQALAEQDTEGDYLLFMGDGMTIKFFHEQNCCEDVYIESIDGDIKDLLFSPITVAEEVTIYGELEDGESGEETFTSTWYKFATIKGSVTVRFYGTSNGYYSEEVTIKMTQKI